MPEAWLSTAAGFHEPVMLLSEATGKVGTEAPSQIVSELPKLNVGITVGLTVTVNVVVVAHWPLVGVKV